MTDVSSQAPGEKRYSIGTLQYTRNGLFRLSAWLLWGDLCLNMFEQIFSRFLPLYMKPLGASDTLIATMTRGTAGFVNIFLGPNINMRSDRHRGRLGRRIPFLLWATPCTVVSLVLITFAPEIGAWVHAHMVAPFWEVPAVRVTLPILCLFVVSYHFFNMVLLGLNNCLIRDVVPQAVMVRFLTAFRIVAAIGGAVFMLWVFGYLREYTKAICVGAGLFCLLAFLAMCWQVKEGQYPPPEETEKRSAVRSFGVYFRQGLSVPIYRNYVLAYAAFMVASACADSFSTLYARYTLHLEMGAIGAVLAWSGLASAIVYVPIGYVCDRLSPFFVLLASLVAYAVLSALAFLFVSDQRTWLVYMVALQVTTVAWGLALTALTMSLFPVQKFAQFSSSMNVIGYGPSMLAGSLLAGLVMDHVWGSDYRKIFLWSAFWYLLAIVPMVLVYRGWKRLGGPDRYVPPVPR
jgi:maltose/moltooligosaccharide transporter